MKRAAHPQPIVLGVPPRGRGGVDPNLVTVRQYHTIIGIKLYKVICLQNVIAGLQNYTETHRKTGRRKEACWLKPKHSTQTNDHCFKRH